MNTEPRGVLVSDFDGTMTRNDFYKMVTAELLPPGCPDYWAQYRTGEITHFEALRRYFAEIRTDEATVLDLVNRMELDPQLPNAVQRLKEAGWRVVVTSAGCGWYIRKLLAPVASLVEVHSNPGRFEAGKGLLMELPTGSPFLSPTLGVDKLGVVRHYLDKGIRLAFAGDGFPDVEPAKLVPDDLRFARGDLAHVLRKEGLRFRPFAAWSDIAGVLLGGGN